MRSLPKASLPGCGQNSRHPTFQGCDALVEGKGVLSQRTIRSNAIVKNTLWALCTAIPIQALR
jgi:hypothetical protein